MKYISLFTFLLFLLVIVLLILILQKKKYSRIENFNTQLTLTIDLGTELSKPTPIPSTENFKWLVRNYYSNNITDKLTVVNKYGFITTWDTSQVTDMSSAFQFAGSQFNGNFDQNFRLSNDINTKIVKYTDSDGNKNEYIAWNTSEVTNMSNMFIHANQFNGDISNWDTSNVTNMHGMFRYAIVFNPLEDKNINIKIVENVRIDEEGNKVPYTAWDTKNVTNMSYMFKDAKSFNGNISNWDTSNVTNMSAMFWVASSFNPQGDQNINTKFVEDVRVLPNGLFQSYIAWDTKNVTNMRDMFMCNIHVSFFNGDISNWDTSNVTNMGGMFRDAIVFNPLEDKNINTKIVENVRIDEEGNKVPYTAWDTKNVTSMMYMFNNATNFNGNISNWDVRNVRRWDYMFNRAYSFYQDITHWKVTLDVDFPPTKMFNIHSPDGVSDYISFVTKFRIRDEVEVIDSNGTPTLEFFNQPVPFTTATTPTTTLTTTLTTTPTSSPTTTLTTTPITTRTTTPSTSPTSSQTTSQTSSPTTTPITTSTTPTTTLTTPTTTSKTTTTLPTTSTTTYKDDPMCRFIPNGQTPRGCVAECLSPRNKNFGGDLCTRNICEAKCSECKNSNLCKWLIQSEYNKDKIKLEGIEGNKRVQLYWNISNIKANDLKEFIIYYKNTNINAGISIKSIPFTQNKKNYSIVIENLDNSKQYSFVVNVINKTNNIEYISNTVNLIPNSNTKLIL